MTLFPDGKFCKTCGQILPITEFYPTGKTLQTLCKACHNAACTIRSRKRREPRKNPFQKLDPEIQEILKKYIGTRPISKISVELGIKASKIYEWRKNGYIV